LETFFSIDPSTYYSIADAFAYARLQPSFGVFHFPYSWGPLAMGAGLAAIVAATVLNVRPIQKQLVRAELSIPKGKGYLSIAILLLLGFSWTAFWSLNPWSNVTPFLTLMNVGALGLFFGMPILMLVSFPFHYPWGVVETEAIEEEARVELDDDLDG